MRISLQSSPVDIMIEQKTGECAIFQLFEWYKNK